MDIKDEYIGLRNEIIYLIQRIDSSRNILYATVGVILSFSFSLDDSLAFCIPYIVIMPMYLVTVAAYDGMYTISTYLQTFLEGDAFNWECRKMKFSERKKASSIFAFNIPFILLSVFSTTMSLFFCLLKIGTYKSYELMFRIGLPILLLCIMSVLVYLNRSIAKNKRSLFLPIWESIKTDEAQETEIELNLSDD